ncbi:hypothetical protein Tco_0882756 [Tanacetum coccineum]
MYPVGGRFVGLEVCSIRRIQWVGYGVLDFLKVGTTFDIFQNIIFIPYLQYGVLVFSGYGLLNKFPLWSLVSMAMAAKAKLLLRELKTVKADLTFVKERCAQLEEENRILRETGGEGDH